MKLAEHVWMVCKKVSETQMDCYRAYGPVKAPDMAAVAFAMGAFVAVIALCIWGIWRR